MWRGCTSDDFTIGSVGDLLTIAHAPSGITYTLGRINYHTEPRDPTIFRAGPDASWACEIIEQSESIWYRAETAGEPNTTGEDERQFRRRFGELRRFVAIRDLNPAVLTPWTEDLAQLMATMAFISLDVEGYKTGRLAYPDQVDCTKTRLPQPLRRIYTNRFASLTP